LTSSGIVGAIYADLVRSTAFCLKAILIGEESVGARRALKWNLGAIHRINARGSRRIENKARSSTVSNVCDSLIADVVRAAASVTTFWVFVEAIIVVWAREWFKGLTSN